MIERVLYAQSVHDEAEVNAVLEVLRGGPVEIFQIPPCLPQQYRWSPEDEPAPPETGSLDGREQTRMGSGIALSRTGCRGIL